MKQFWNHTQSETKAYCSIEIETIHIDSSVIDVLKLIGEYPDRATWYPLARKTKHNIIGLLSHLHVSGYVTFKEAETPQGNIERYYTLTKNGHRLILDWVDERGHGRGT